MDRRRFLAAASAGAAALAGCTALGGGGGSGPSDSYGDWFGDVDNYDGEVDRTGTDRPTVQVGADDGLAFAPAAIVVSPGTTVVWEWTGKGGNHNVVHTGGSFESEYHNQAGATFETALSETGVYTYFCEPHQSAGMKGGVRVEG